MLFRHILDYLRRSEAILNKVTILIVHDSFIPLQSKDVDNDDPQRQSTIHNDTTTVEIYSSTDATYVMQSGGNNRKTNM